MSTHTAAMLRSHIAYEIYLGYEECACPEVNTRWIIILHGTTDSTCTWYTTAKLPKLDGYYKHEKSAMGGGVGKHGACEYNVSKKQIGRLGADEKVLFDALFEATQPQQSRRAIVAWLGRLVDEGLLDRGLLDGVMRECVMLR